METLKTIVLALTGQAVMLAVLGYVGKSLFERLIARDIKRFENDLKAKSDAAIEQLKNTLQLQTIEHQVRFVSFPVALNYRNHRVIKRRIVAR